MKKFLSIFGDGRDDSNLSKSGGILNQPGDRLEAKITQTERKVLKIHTEGGDCKYSATQYPNGTLVETKVTKKK